MFQTGWILALQTLESGFLTVFMQMVSILGDGDVMPLLLLGFMFGLHLRAGFLSFHAWIWAATINGVLKCLVRYPRPFHVDAAVRTPGLINPGTLEAGGGGKGFFSLLPPESRLPRGIVPVGGFSFPSAHCAGTAAWAGLSSGLLSSPLWRLSLSSWILVMAVSRLYLGMHFPADVIFGSLIGLSVAAALLPLGRSAVLQWWLQQPFLRFRAGWRRPLLLSAALGGPLLILIIPHAYPTAAARLLGLNLGFLAAWWRGLPAEQGRLRQRLTRVSIGLAIYGLIFFGPVLLLPGDEPAWLDMARHFLAPFTALAAGIPISIRIGAWSR
ncbi:MAG: phosphatase PAP2 family protein [Acidobacteriota bacterium]|jgi:membrane-associated phospholipid phosphatase|nr:phosphatase PAP2 family protein [Acidobacteriota bacterium]